MKNLHYHKRQIQQHRARNRFQQWANNQLDAISQRVTQTSNARWDALLDALPDRYCQRCADMGMGKDYTHTSAGCAFATWN
jgi:lysophospholipase L1-like esterase